MSTSLPDLLRLAKLDPAGVVAVYRCGSRVYGTATPQSDEDFVIVGPGAKMDVDLLFLPNINAGVRSRPSFQKALDDASMMALECHFAPPEHVLRAPSPPFSFKLRRDRVRDSALDRARADLKTAEKRFDADPESGRRKLYHAIRVLLFARQVVTHGRIVDFGEAAPVFEDVMSFPASAWAPLGAAFVPVFRQIEADLSAVR